MTFYYFSTYTTVYHRKSMMKKNCVDFNGNILLWRTWKTKIIFFYKMLVHSTGEKKTQSISNKFITKISTGSVWEREGF